MKKLVVVRFEKAGPRVYVGEAAARVARDPNSLINPARPKHIPQHLWRREGNTIVASGEPVQHRIRRFHYPSLLTGVGVGILIPLLGILIAFLCH